MTQIALHSFALSEAEPSSSLDPQDSNISDTACSNSRNSSSSSSIISAHVMAYRFLSVSRFVTNMCNVSVVA